MTTPDGTPPGPTPAAAIAGIRRTATGILAVLALVFVATFAVPDPDGRVLLVRSMAEAGMVGGLADWFAVEALFRHPLRLPIPHTALLPRNQKRAARNIARFIDEYFLASPRLLARIRQSNPVRIAAGWLAEGANARLVARDLSGLLRLVLKQQVGRGMGAGAAGVLRSVLEAAVRTDDLSASIAALLRETVRSRLMDDIIAEVRNVLDGSRDKVTDIVQERSRWWIASAVDRQVVKLLVDGILSIMDELSDRRSGLRQDFDRSVVRLVESLHQSGRIAAFIDEGRDKYFDSPEFASAVDRVLSAGLNRLHQHLDETPVRTADLISTAIVEFADLLRRDPVLQESLNARLLAGAEVVLATIRPAVATYVTRVIEDWDSADFVARIEREVGYDLQFIRINGAVLGAMVGGVLHLITGILP